MSPGERKLLIDLISNDSSLWRAEAWIAYAQVWDELQRVRCAKAWGSQDVRECEIKIVQADLDAALRLMAPAPSRWRTCIRRFGGKLALYYSGAQIERTWSAIHRANATLYMLYHESELAPQAMRLQELVSALPDLKPQEASLATVLNDLKKTVRGRRRSLGIRATLRELYQEAMGRSDLLQVEARRLRNSLLAASAALLVVVCALGVAHAIDQGILPFCETVNGDSVCLSGSSSGRFDVFVVALAGLLGGALSMIIPIATGERINTPYRVFNHQLLLKMVTGAATGIAGVALVESDFIAGFTLESGTAIFGYAIFFGFAQQALTGMIDHRASSLAKETPATKSV